MCIVSISDIKMAMTVLNLKCRLLECQLHYIHYVFQAISLTFATSITSVFSTVQFHSRYLTD